MSACLVKDRACHVASGFNPCRCHWSVRCNKSSGCSVVRKHIADVVVGAEDRKLQCRGRTRGFSRPHIFLVLLQLDLVLVRLAPGESDVLGDWAAGFIWVGATVVLAGWEVLRKAALSIQIGGNAVLHSRYWRTAWVTGLLLIAVGVVMLSNRPAPEMV